jgi:o-succinylbenzoate synthase
MVRVAGARVFEVQGPLDESVANAKAVWCERRSLLLELTDEAGRIGQGEASPLPGFSRESFDQVCTELVGIDWASLPEFDPAGSASGTIEKTIEERLDMANLRTPAARFAAETALLDLTGQVAGKPISQLLAGTGSARPIETALRPRVALAALLAGDVLAAASGRVDRGYRHLKLKVGRSPAEDLALLATLRAELGPEIGLRADANGSLAPEALPAWLGSAAELELEFVEEPVPLGALKALKGQRPSPVPLAIDESLSPGDEAGLPAALEAGGYRYTVLKPSYHGGLIRCQRLAGLARSRGAEPVVSHLFEGPVALAGAAELALALAPCPPAGLAPHAGLEHWPSIQIPAFREAELVPHDTPGLGLPPLAERLAEEAGVRLKELRP